MKRAPEDFQPQPGDAVEIGWARRSETTDRAARLADFYSPGVEGLRPSLRLILPAGWWKAREQATDPRGFDAPRSRVFGRIPAAQQEPTRAYVHLLKDLRDKVSREEEGSPLGIAPRVEAFLLASAEREQVERLARQLEAAP
jgi:hypothetical protein